MIIQSIDVHVTNYSTVAHQVRYKPTAEESYRIGGCRPIRSVGVHVFHITSHIVLTYADRAGAPRSAELLLLLGYSPDIAQPK